MDLGNIAGVFVGAGLGGVLRYSLGGWIAERAGAAFPWHTMVINLAGAVLLGLLMALSIERGAISPGARLFLGVGLLGGFTTFSTLSYETLSLLREGLVVQGVFNMAGSLVLGLIAAAAGMLLGRAI